MTQRRTATSRYPAKFKLWLLGLSLIGAAVVGELGLRVVWRNPYAKQKEWPILPLRLNRANSDLVVNREEISPNDPVTRFRTGSRNYILPSFQHDSPDFTVAFLGGSTTACIAVREDRRFPTRVSSLLAEADLKVNSLNAGRSGNTLHDSMNNLFNHVVHDKPDVVVLMHAVNDIGLLKQAGNYRPRSGHVAGWRDVARILAHKITAQCYSAALIRQVGFAQGTYRPTLPDPLKHREFLEPSSALDGTYEKSLRAYVRVCHAFQMQPVLMTQPMASDFTSLTPDWADRTAQDRFNDIIRRVGREERALVVDLVRHLQESVPNWDEHLVVFYDAIHLTDDGSEIYAQHITKTLLPVLTELQSRATKSQENKLAAKTRNSD